MFKEEFVGSKKLMSPTMNKRLSVIQDIMDLIIEAQEPNNAFLLFKLLTLDLSPCLTKFIINIFIKVFKKSEKNEWLNELVNIFLVNDYEIIITNTFIHSLPDVRLDIIVLMYQIYDKCRNNKTFKLEQMIKTCLLPQKMFYATKSEIKYNNEDINETIKNENNESNQNNINLNFISDKRKSACISFQKENNLGNENKNNLDIIKEELNASENNENKDAKIEEEKNFDIKNQLLFHSQTIENPIIIKKENKSPNNNAINMQNANDNLMEQKEILILKDELYQNYIDNLFSKLMEWSLGIMDNNNSKNTKNYDNDEIKFLNGLEILFHLNSELNSYEFTHKFLSSLLRLVEKQKINAYKLLQNKSIISSILNLIFNKQYYGKETNKEKCSNEGKLLLVKILSSSLIYSNDNNANNKNLILPTDDLGLPARELETIFIWGNKILLNDGVLQT
jgi:hypothetical protein